MTTIYTELTERRTRFATTSAIVVDGQPTGLFRTIVRAKPQHYETAPGAGDWQPIDRNLEETPTVYRTVANNWRCQLRKTYTGAAPVRVDLRGGFDLGWKLAGLAHLSTDRTVTVLAPSISGVTATRNGQVVTYPAVAGAGIDLRYDIGAHSLKQDLVLSAAALAALRAEVVARSLGGGYLVVSYALDLGSMAGWSLGLGAGSEVDGEVPITGGSVRPSLGRPVASDDSGREVNCLYRRISHPQLGPTLLVGVPLSWLSGATGSVVIDPTFYGDTADGIIVGTSATYSTARSTSSGVNTTGAVANLGQRLQTGNYTVWRAFVSADTSSIPDGDTVSAASIFVKSSSDTSDTDFLVKVYRFAWTDPLGTDQEGNFDGAYGGSATLEGTLRDTASGWVAGTYYSLALDPAGINKTGNSRYALVSSRDVGNNTPAGNEYVNWYTADQTGTGDDPYLDITHAGSGSSVPLFMQHYRQRRMGRV